MFQNKNAPPDLLNKAKTRLVYVLCQTGREEEADKVRSCFIASVINKCRNSPPFQILQTEEKPDKDQRNGQEIKENDDAEAGGSREENGESNAAEPKREDDESSIDSQQQQDSVGSVGGVGGVGGASAAAVKGSRFELRPVRLAGGQAAAASSPSNGGGGGGGTPTTSRKEKRSKERKERKRNSKNRLASTSEDSATLHCQYCDVTLPSQQEFQAHCRGDAHQRAIFSDKGRDWRHRAPPRGVGSESYRLCVQFREEGHCRFGGQCVEAHTEEELKEWKERFEFRKSKAQRAAKLFGKTFVDVVLEKLGAAKQVDRVVQPRIVGISCSCPGELDVQVSKNEELSWVFELKAGPHLLQDVGLLNDANRRHFSLEYVKHLARDRVAAAGAAAAVEGPPKSYKPILSVRTFQLGTTASESDGAAAAASANEVPEGHQEWSHACLDRYSSGSGTKKQDMTYRVKISFRTNVFGTFRQSVIFHFSGLEQYLRRDLCVDVAPTTGGGDDDKEEEDPEAAAKKFKERLVHQSERWDEKNSTIVDFDPPISRLDDADEALLATYPHPQPQTFLMSKATSESGPPTRQGFRERMHDMLYIEELEQCKALGRFNVVARLQLTANYLLMSTSASSSTAKYSRKGELFGKMSLGQDLSEDTSAGRLILTNCSMLMLSKPGSGGAGKDQNKRDKKKSSKSSSSSSTKRVAYIAAIEDTGKNTLYLRLSSKMVKDLNLKEDGELEVEIQFQLNRVPLCESHYAVDKVPDLALVHPDMSRKFKIPWSPGKQWQQESAESSATARLNPKQREAIVAITTDLTDEPLPPVLIIGPYGTGKTFTLGQAVKLLLRQEGARVLVCTHSNSAADLYIRDYLDPYVEENPEKTVKLRRVYYRNRWVQTVHQTVQKYCLISETEGARVFRNPRLEDVVDCQVVVATLSTSRYLGNIGLEQGHFTHILIDEAAQAMECEALMPLALASSRTRIVLAGEYSRSFIGRCIVIESRLPLLSIHFCLSCS